MKNTARQGQKMTLVAVAITTAQPNKLREEESR